MFFGGMAWITVANSLSVSAQLALPDWVRARGMSMYQMAIMGASAIGAAIWGQVATVTSLVASLSVAAISGTLLMLMALRWVTDVSGEDDTSPAQAGWAAGPPTEAPAGRRPRGHHRRIHDRPGPRRGLPPGDAADPPRAPEPGRHRLGAAARHRASRSRYVEQIVDESWTDHLRRFNRATASRHGIARAAAGLSPRRIAARGHALCGAAMSMKTSQIATLFGCLFLIGSAEVLAGPMMGAMSADFGVRSSAIAYLPAAYGAQLRRGGPAGRTAVGPLGTQAAAARRGCSGSRCSALSFPARPSAGRHRPGRALAGVCAAAVRPTRWLWWPTNRRPSKWEALGPRLHRPDAGVRSHAAYWRGGWRIRGDGDRPTTRLPPSPCWPRWRFRAPSPIACPAPARMRRTWTSWPRTAKH